MPETIKMLHNVVKNARVHFYNKPFSSRKDKRENRPHIIYHSSFRGRTLHGIAIQLNQYPQLQFQLSAPPPSRLHPTADPATSVRRSILRNSRTQRAHPLH